MELRRVRDRLVPLLFTDPAPVIAPVADPVIGPVDVLDAEVVVDETQRDPGSGMADISLNSQ